MEAPDFGILRRQVLIRVPVAILDTLYTSVFDKSLAGFNIQWSVNLVREVHILSRTRFKVSELLMLLRYFIGVLHESLVEIELFVFIVVLSKAIIVRFLVLILSSDDLNFHSFEHLFEGLVFFAYLVEAANFA